MPYSCSAPGCPLPAAGVAITRKLEPADDGIGVQLIETGRSVCPFHLPALIRHGWPFQTTLKPLPGWPPPVIDNNPLGY